MTLMLVVALALGGAETLEALDRDAEAGSEAMTAYRDLLDEQAQGCRR